MDDSEIWRFEYSVVQVKLRYRYRHTVHIAKIIYAFSMSSHLATKK